jgi:hypothetical protein
MRRSAIAIGCIALLLTLAASTAVPGQAQGVTLKKPEFSHPLVIDNRYFPLKPETTFIYGGTEDGEPTYERFVVTERTKLVMGIETRVIHDRNWVNDELVEDTFDWFAQDDAGNVWYFGEFSTQYENGRAVGHEGSWRAGVNGASPGIVMEAKPKKGDTYREERAPGIAEDTATVLSLYSSVCVPLRCFSNVLKTKEFSPLEPGAFEYKYYAREIGLIKSFLAQGGSEVSRLIKIERE